MAPTIFDMSVQGLIPQLANGDLFVAYVSVTNVTNEKQVDDLELFIGNVDGEPEGSTRIELDAGETKEFPVSWEVRGITEPQRRSFSVVTTEDTARSIQNAVILRPYDNTIRMRRADGVNNLTDKSGDPIDGLNNDIEEKYISDANDVGPNN